MNLKLVIPPLSYTSKGDATLDRPNSWQTVVNVTTQTTLIKTKMPPHIFLVK